MQTYNSVKLKNKLKRDFVIEKLLEQGINKSQDGISVHKLSYEELKYELVLSAFREIDVESDENRWF